MLLCDDLWCHVQRSAANRLVHLIPTFELFRKAKISNLDRKDSLAQIQISQEPLPLLLVHVHELFSQLREMQHDVLKFQITVDNQNV